MDSFKQHALQVLADNNISPENLIALICLTTYHNTMKCKYIYDDIEYTVAEGHVNLSLMAKTKDMSNAIPIYFVSDH